MGKDTAVGAYQHLGVFSDWVSAARERRQLCPLARPGAETRRLFRECLGFCDGPEQPQDVLVAEQWEHNGVSGEVISWSVGYGPRTEAWVLKPAGASARLPGILALHDHGGYKFYGKEKIADGPVGEARGLRTFREAHYGGRAYANALAREGYVVLIHDAFMWGSRRFPLETMRLSVGSQQDDTAVSDLPAEIAEYNRVAGRHEHTVSKYGNLLGTNMAGMVCFEDRVAVNVLLARADVLPERIGCIGLSGGGNRAAMLLATHDAINAAAIVGLMSTYEELLGMDLSHTWMMFPFNWARHGDWPDVAACRAPMPLLVQNDLEDELFTAKGMRDAHDRIAAHYGKTSSPEAYLGEFYPGPHKFDLKMQAAAFAWFRVWL